MKKSPRIMTESGYTAHMCLIVFDWHPGSEQWLTLSANRDEVFYRPTRPLQPWPQHIAATAVPQLPSKMLLSKRVTPCTELR